MWLCQSGSRRWILGTASEIWSCRGSEHGRAPHSKMSGFHPYRVKLEYQFYNGSSPFRAGTRSVIGSVGTNRWSTACLPYGLTFYPVSMVVKPLAILKTGVRSLSSEMFPSPSVCRIQGDGPRSLTTRE